MNNGAFASAAQLTQLKWGIFGLGVTGKAVCKLASRLGVEFIVVNQSVEEVSGALQVLSQNDPNAGEALAQCDVILLSPGIPREHEVLTLTHAKNIPVWNEIELGFRLVREKLPQTKWLAITGTNGKTTTVTLLGEMLECDGRGVFVGGNIGTPLSELACDVIEGKVTELGTVVLELSSFQLESLESYRPHGAAILNISASHGERYESVRDYALAKARIVSNLGAGDNFFSLKNDTWTEKVIKPGPWLWERIDSDNLDFCGLEVSGFTPFGHHNLVNLSFAIKLAKHAGASDQAIQTALNNFKGVAHRLEQIYESEDALILNDSKSTNWASTLAALKSVRSDERWGNSAITLLVGGKCRGGNDFPDTETIEVLKQQNLKLCLFGEFAKNYEEQMREKFSELEIVRDFKNLVSVWNKKGVLLFSPAFPSFDEFTSYSDRGDSFKKLVQA